jgi:hypothetical protein
MTALPPCYAALPDSISRHARNRPRQLFCEQQKIGSSDIAGPVARNSLFFWRAISLTASATPELGGADFVPFQTLNHSTVPPALA